MGNFLNVIICGLTFSVALNFIYFRKKHIKSGETEIFSVLLVVNLISLITEFLCSYIGYNFPENSLLSHIVTKSYLICLMTFLLYMTLYIYVICYVSSKKPNLKYYDWLKYISYVIWGGCSGMCILLPITTHVGYATGLAVNWMYICSTLVLIEWAIPFIKNFKIINKHKAFPLILFVIFMIVISSVQRFHPEITITTVAEFLIIFIMFHTIENPDMQLIGELYKNKKLIEKTNEDHSKFMFRMTQDIKKPVKDIVDISDRMVSMKDSKELLSASKSINNYGKQVDYLINKALNISNMDTQKIKVFDSRYNINNVFKEVTFRAKEVIKEGIKFDFSIGSSIPTYLYGDSIKLKQIISSLINISNDFTKEGFISLDISSIERYGICRLIITVEDSGKGISIDRVNEILSLSEKELTDIDVTNVENRNLDIFSVKKLVNMLGGTLMVKSEEGVGTTVTIILEQKIVETNKTEMAKTLESYEHAVYGEKQILVIDDDERELKEIEKQIQEDGIMVSTSVYGRDAIEKARSKIKYDLIILDDEMDTYSAYEVLKALKKVKDFKTPVVVMINDNKEGIKLHYLKDGFADVISKSKLESEIERVLKRF